MQTFEQSDFTTPQLDLVRLKSIRTTIWFTGDLFTSSLPPPMSIKSGDDSKSFRGLYHAGYRICWRTLLWRRSPSKHIAPYLKVEPTHPFHTHTMEKYCHPTIWTRTLGGKNASISFISLPPPLACPEITFGVAVKDCIRVGQEHANHFIHTPSPTSLMLSITTVLSRTAKLSQTTVSNPLSMSDTDGTCPRHETHGSLFEL